MSPAEGFAQESARLLDAVQSWLAGAGSQEDAPSGDRGSDQARDEGRHHHPHHTGPECRVCPICQVLSVVRTAKPEVLAHLGDAMTSLAAAFAELVPTDDASPPRPAPDDTEHIVVTGEDDVPATPEPDAAAG